MAYLGRRGRASNTSKEINKESSLTSSQSIESRKLLSMRPRSVNEGEDLKNLSIRF